MNSSKNKTYNDNIKEVDAILMKEWDPIGVSDVIEAQDEYRQYSVLIAVMLKKDVSENDVALELNRIETDMFAMTPNTERALRVAHQLVGLKNTA